MIYYDVNTGKGAVVSVDSWMRAHPQRRGSQFDRYAADILRLLRENFTYEAVAQCLFDELGVSREIQGENGPTRGPVTAGAIRLWAMRRANKREAVDEKGAAIAETLHQNAQKDRGRSSIQRLLDGSPAQAVAPAHPNVAAAPVAAPTPAPAPAPVKPALRIAPGVSAEVAVKLAADPPAAPKPISTEDLLAAMNRGEPLPIGGTDAGGANA